MTIESQEAPPRQLPQSSIFRRVAFWIAVVWFCSFHVLWVLIIVLTTDFDADAGPSLSALLFLVFGGLAWLVAAYWIYDELFRMAEARWPAAKGIRAVLSSLLKSFLHHH
ncbi:hypothetical protein JQ604_30760 [Bradyrhizobium jicamae]|uniref:hypothetical protein n=1 Tax=Bradyrhizobium jicamae TaxID=280332 RepID=UPI001BA72F20|nr:hypothetical protein [Bradyrhizobium jicamae]MBR0756582.1 hypothetical protein [Bradyrhizobium jicamae]